MMLLFTLEIFLPLIALTWWQQRKGRMTVLFPRPKKRISKASSAILVFLTMAALFFLRAALPPDHHVPERPGSNLLGRDLFPAPCSDAHGLRPRVESARSGMTCTGLRARCWNSILILIPSMITSVSLSMVTGYALAI